MTTTIKAVFEGGVFRPTGQIALSEGTQVEVIVPVAAAARDPKAVAAQLARIASQVSVSSQCESASLNHDQFLYAPNSQP
jgi:predicted DNA-binding antitoxin AbrB/MazE fold protein